MEDQPFLYNPCEDLILHKVILYCIGATTKTIKQANLLQ